MNLILLHGLGQSPVSWDKTALSLPENIKPDCPDLFSLCRNSDKTYKNIYTALERYINGFPESINLCGLSLGAVLAINYAIDHAAKVKSLVLIAPQYKVPRFLFRLQNIVFHIMPEQSFSKSGLIKSDMLRLSDSMSTLDFTNNLHNISCPALIICGKEDKVNIKAAKSLTKIIPDTNLLLIAHAGHEVNIEAPNELATVIHLFYKEKHIY